MTPNHDAIVSSVSCSLLNSSCPLFLSVSAVSSFSAHSLSLYLLSHSSFKAATSALSITFISFASCMSFLYLSLCLFLFFLQSNCQALTSTSFIFHPSLSFLCPLVFSIYFHSLHVFHSLLPTGTFITLINFSAYEMMFLSKF